ncbi:MAG TPA: hypothetical protein DD392_07830 [Ruminococcus sp.]|nr:hypothetical protein [Ruminococcus sp.]
MLGDLDESETLTSYDALLILQNVVQLNKFDAVDNAVGDVADMNDGQITSYDALQILQVVVQLQSDFSGALYVDVHLPSDDEVVEDAEYLGGDKHTGAEIADTRAYYAADKTTKVDLDYSIRQD